MSRIVLLYADTGGGHRSAAEAIARGFEIDTPGRHDVSLVNAIAHMAFPYNQMERSYPAVVNGPRLLHQLSFHATNSRRRSWILRVLLRLAGANMARDVLVNHPADVYVSCSPIYTQVLPYYMARWHRATPFVVVATDLVSGHAFNYAPEADLMLVPTEYAQREAIANQVAPESIVVTGQPVSPDIQARTRQASDALRLELGFDHALPLVLLIGGGDGMGRLGATARAIAQSDLRLQLLVVCGRNDAVKMELDQLPQRTVRMKTLGFVNTVPELMGLADILVTKAGAATVAEAFIAGLPMLIYDAIPGQEDGNWRYVSREGAGAYKPEPADIVAELRRLLADTAALARMRLASTRLAKPDAAIAIARAITHLSCAIAKS
ncbi:MAG TPA: glycosyltransferase [Anaerolineae bacterium]|jgi:1,2-diacylglycerol 3-beta-galactosyltransferase